MKHTPGPWKMIDHGEETISVTDGVQDEGVCVVGNAYEKETLKANAHLIAAAPEMLEALNAAITWFEIHAASGGPSIDPDRKIFDKMVFAVLKANGR